MLKGEGELSEAKVAEFTNSKLQAQCGSLEKEIASNKEMRQNVLDEMRVWYQKFTAETQTNDTRSKALQQLAAAYDTYLESESNLQEGIKVALKQSERSNRSFSLQFYSDLNVLLTRLQQQVDGWLTS